MKIRGRKAMGQKSEELACDFLLSRGQRIVEKNWRSGHLEVDIISEAKDGLHFVEVKSLLSPMDILPQDKVGAIKRHRITDAANDYINSHPTPDGKEIFFDVISVVFDKETISLKYFPQAWIPMHT
ncbi:MAG: YraN family protein [Bacteroidales bacterium]|nr:YraN family protein [Bacteroidales bacterium]